MLIGRGIRSRLRSGLGFGDLIGDLGYVAYSKLLWVGRSIEWDMGMIRWSRLELFCTIIYVHTASIMVTRFNRISGTELVPRNKSRRVLLVRGHSA